MTPFDVTTSDATALAQSVRSREISAREPVEAALQRISEVESIFNAFRVVLAQEALAEAETIDSLTDAELAALPLAGVPVAIKDDTDVVAQSTMWGTAVDRGVRDRDAEVVRRLRRAGATIIGKTNVPELTLWPWTASEPWGVTRNPWDPERTPGGSSGGSAAAVCTGMAAMAVGSDGGGSVRYPAGLTGLVGVKPQRGRVSPASPAASINRVFETADVVLTPLCEAAAPRLVECPTRGALRSLRAASTSAWLVPWNLTGQPAIAVPMGFDDDNLPTSIQLAGRPGDEVTLLGLAAQVEQARPFRRWSATSPSDS